MSEPKAHAKYAASNSKQWLACPGSIKLSEKAPKKEDTKASTEGTTAHELMEFCLNSNINNVVSFFENEEEKYPLEMREHVQGLVKFVREELHKIGPHAELLVEERVYLDGVITDEDEEKEEDEAFGTVDIAIVEPYGLLHIIDFKYGTQYVDHVENPQLIYYGLGLAHKLGYDIEALKTTVYQPRAYVKGSDKIARSYTLNMNQVREWKCKFYEGVKACEEPEPRLSAGEHCFFCPAKIICPEITKKSLERAKLKFQAPVQPDPKN